MVGGMTSQIDYDQGGTFRGLVKAYLGPSIGWTLWGSNVILPVATPGTITVQPGNTNVQVNAAGAVTVNLPPVRLPQVPPGVLPGLQSPIPITVVDIGGNAGSFPITIMPAIGETIMGLSQVQITVQYGAFVLWPSIAIPGWTASQ